MVSPITPTKLKSQLRQRARHEQAYRAIEPGEVWRRFFLQRLMARVFTHRPDAWLLKGGLAMLVRHPGARHSRDLDLLHRAETDLAEALEDLLAAAAVNLGDLVRFSHHSTHGGPSAHGAHAAAGRPSRTVRFTPFLGVEQHNPIHVDLVAEMDPVGPPVHRPFASLIDDLPGNDVQLRLVSLEDHLADKICALYELHNGVPSSRVKDLVDLVYAATHDPVDGPVLRQALQKELQRMRNQHTDITLPQRFHVPAASIWTQGYDEHIRTTDAGQQLGTFAAATALADAFLTPLLSGATLGRWDPETRQWSQQQRS